MKSGAIASICVLCLLVVACPGCGEEEILFLDGEPCGVSWAEADTERLVPIERVAPRFGIQVRTLPGDLFEFRWNVTRDVFPIENFPLVDDQPAASVDWLATLVEAKMHRIGGDTYVETAVPELTELDADSESVTIRFDGFAPTRVVPSSDGQSLSIRFDHCNLGVEPRLILLPAGIVARVQLSTSSGGADIVIQTRKPSAYDTRRYVESGFFAFTIEFEGTEREETITRLASGVALHEIEGTQTRGRLRIDMLSIEDWRERYQLCVTVPSAGLNVPVPLSELARGSGADFAIDASLFDEAGAAAGTLVSHGIPYRTTSHPESLLAVDLFGRIHVLEDRCVPQFLVNGEPVAIDGVNRSLAYGELIAYPPGYRGEIARGVPGSFCVIKVRDRAIVSVYDGPLVVTDPSATIIVASGDARTRVSWTSLGDAARLSCSFVDPESPSPIDAAACERFVVLDGATRVGEESAGDPPASRAWSLLALDFYGGLSLVTLYADESSCGVSETELAHALDLLQTRFRTVVALGSAQTAGLVYRDTRDYHGLPEGRSSVAALCLIPRTP